ncbi:MAG: hypothetical protein V4591_01435 [Bdellovibrionota bacterium]
MQNQQKLPTLTPKPKEAVEVSTGAPEANLLRAFENQNKVALWSQGQRQISIVEMSDNILKALAFARRCGSLRVGLEQIQTILQNEETGLVLMDKSTAEKKAKSEINISRLIFISNDGSERFYRHTETILNKYSH